MLEEPAGHEYDVCAGMLRAASTTRACAVAAAAAAAVAAAAAAAAAVGENQTKQRINADFRWTCAAASQQRTLIPVLLSPQPLLRRSVLMSQQPEQKSPPFDLTSACQRRESSKL